jgi:predicted nucleic acid-binding protein
MDRRQAAGRGHERGAAAKNDIVGADSCVFPDVKEFPSQEFYKPSDEHPRRIPTNKFRLSREKIDLAMETASAAAGKIIELDTKIAGICRDSDDDNIFACSIAAGADCLVTGYSDLLDIKNYLNAA